MAERARLEAESHGNENDKRAAVHRLAIVDDEFLTPLPRTLLSRMRRSSSGRAIWRGREASVQTAGTPVVVLS